MRNKATEEIKSEDPEALLEANCFGSNDKERIKYYVREMKFINIHQDIFKRQNCNYKLDVIRLENGVDQDRINFLLDFKQNMGG